MRACSESEHGLKDENFLGLGLTSRKNLCVHPSVRSLGSLWKSVVGADSRAPQQVSKEKKGKAVDARCRDMTNGSARKKEEAEPGSVELCSWHEVRPHIHPHAAAADQTFSARNSASSNPMPTFPRASTLSMTSRRTGSGTASVRTLLSDGWYVAS